MIDSYNYGNRCGHDKLNPLPFERNKSHAERPKFLECCISKAKLFYSHPDKYLKRLNFICKIKSRQQRSERREAISLVLQSIFYYLDLKTFQICINTKHLSIVDIAKRAKISFSRTKRAIADLIKAGYIRTQHRRSKRTNGDFIAYAAIRIINIRLFTDLGFTSHRTYKAQHYALKKFKSNKNLAINLITELGDYLPIAKKICEGKKGTEILSSLKQILTKKPYIPPH